MSILKESPVISGLAVLEDAVQEVKQRTPSEPHINEPVGIDVAESEMLHCVTPDPQQPLPVWIGAFRRQLKGKLSKNERHQKEIKKK